MTDERKIAMFVHDDPLAPAGSQETGGQAVYVHHLVKELSKKGYFVDVFLRCDSMHKKTVSQFTKRARVIRLQGGPKKYLPRKQLFDFLPELYDDFLAYINGQNSYDLFHGHYWDGGWLAMTAAHEFKKPFIENFHSLGKIREETRQKYSFTSAVKDIFNQRFLTEKAITKNASVIVSLAESEKTALEHHYGADPEKVQVIPGGVDHRIFFPRNKVEARQKIHAKPEEFILLFVGRLEWRKGVGTLIHATEIIQKEIPQVKIIVVGGKIHGKQKNIDDFEEYQRLLGIAKRKNIESAVHFAGSIDHNRLPLFYSAADVFVVPSYYEPFGLVVLESMACKTPVVASMVDGLVATVKDGVTGVLFSPRHADDLARKVITLYKSKQLQETLAQNANKKIAADYSWKNIGERIHVVYDT